MQHPSPSAHPYYSGCVSIMDPFSTRWIHFKVETRLGWWEVECSTDQFGKGIKLEFTPLMTSLWYNRRTWVTFYRSFSNQKVFITILFYTCLTNKDLPVVSSVLILKYYNAKKAHFNITVMVLVCVLFVPCWLCEYVSPVFNHPATLCI